MLVGRDAHREVVIRQVVGNHGPDQRIVIDKQDHVRPISQLGPPLDPERRRDDPGGE